MLLQIEEEEEDEKKIPENVEKSQDLFFGCNQGKAEREWREWKWKNKKCRTRIEGWIEDEATRCNWKTYERDETWLKMVITFFFIHFPIWH